MPWLNAAGLCLVDVVQVYFTCLFFLIYWEARQYESSREPGALDKLPAEERKEWVALWAEVDALLNRATGP